MSKVTVLIIEDDASIRDIYTHAFNGVGIGVITAPDGGTGVDLALQHHPDLILVDIDMPVMNGHETVYQIRKDEWGKSAKVVYLTNMDDAENVIHAVEQGSDKYIIKANMTPTEVVKQARMIMGA